MRLFLCTSPPSLSPMENKSNNSPLERGGFTAGGGGLPAAGRGVLTFAKQLLWMRFYAIDNSHNLLYICR